MAEISETLKLPMKLWPPTISAMGRAIRVKLTMAPPTAMARTKAETKNWLIAEDDSTRVARSLPRRISS